MSRCTRCTLDEGGFHPFEHNGLIEYLIAHRDVLRTKPPRNRAAEARRRQREAIPRHRRKLGHDTRREHWDEDLADHDHHDVRFKHGGAAVHYEVDFFLRAEGSFDMSAAHYDQG